MRVNFREKKQLYKRQERKRVRKSKEIIICVTKAVWPALVTQCNDTALEAASGVSNPLVEMYCMYSVFSLACANVGGVVQCNAIASRT
jgi:hypothetical protein